jgi:hypothetical protein
MQWPEFAHAVRAAGAILGEDRVVVIGSQSILAWFDDPPPHPPSAQGGDNNRPGCHPEPADR